MLNQLYAKLAAIRIENHFGKESALRFYPELTEYINTVEVSRPKDFQLEQQRLYAELRARKYLNKAYEKGTEISRRF